MAQKKKWSYNAGERNRNWVRAYCKGCLKPCTRASHHSGDLYLEWREDEVDPATNALVRKRRSAKMTGVSHVAEAKRRADKLAAEFANASAQQQSIKPTRITFKELVDQYVAQKTPLKGTSKRDHDIRARRVWLAFLDAQVEDSRKTKRHPSTFDRIDWERFVDWRRSGRIPGCNSCVRNKAISDDLSFLVSVLNWAVGAQLLDRNPWDGSIRRAQGWPKVKEHNPHRPDMPDELRAELVKHSANWALEVQLILQRETRRRNSAIRQLLWSDIDLANATIRWRSETDKSGRSNVTPMSQKAYDAICRIPNRGSGDAPLFPHGWDATRPSSRHTPQRVLRRAKAALLNAATTDAEREELKKRLRGVGYHSEKRAGVRDPEFRSLPPKIQEEIAGTNFQTLSRIYDDVKPDAIRKVWKAAKAPES